MRGGVLMENPAGRFASGWANSTLMTVVPLVALTLNAVILFCESACACAPNMQNAMSIPANWTAS